MGLIFSNWASMNIPPKIEMASLGMWDTLILMILALIVFGPRRLPEIGRQIGKLMFELRKASSDFKVQIEEELRTAEEADRRRKEAEAVPALPAPAETVVSGAESSTDTGNETASAAVESPYPGEGNYPQEYPPPTPEPVVEQVQLPANDEQQTESVENAVVADEKIEAIQEEQKTEHVNQNG
jgi:sec-independent protein translocase protein TatB